MRETAKQFASAFAPPAPATATKPDTAFAEIRTDVSYLPDLKAYLHDLLRDRERVLAATELDAWARDQALPSEEEIRRIRALIGQAEAHLGQLADDDRAGLEEAARLVRRGRQAVPLGMPRVRPSAPDLRLDRTS